MRLLVFTWPYALIFWIVFFWAFAPEFAIVRGRPQERSETAQDANSKRLIMNGQFLATFAAFWIAGGVPIAALPHPVWLFWAGIGAMVAGSLLRRHCWKMLGDSFTGAVIVKSDQAVVDRGAYRYIRHPSYTGGAILFLGIGLVLANWISIAVLLLSIAIVYSYRVRIEEAALASVIGEPYRAYMMRTKRFVPFFF
jgi:protein-S-isoprenylcysteine O-methyltransferase Ste14